MDASFSRRTVLAGTAALAMAPAVRGGTMPRRPASPLVLGHRGACALRPEHTLASYERAIADGADFIEPDLVPTKDGHLVARHEPNIADTTDVADHPEFADRRATRVIDGQKQDGWFTTDFTLAELQTLRARERLGALRPISQSFNGQFPVPTLDEIVGFLQASNARTGRTVGLIPEIKHSTWFASLGFDMEALFLAAVRRHRLLHRVPLIVQSFEVSNLKRLRKALRGMANVQLMQLLDDDGASPADAVAQGQALTYREMATPAGLSAIAGYADWAAPAWSRIVPLATDGTSAPVTSFIADAHKAGLLAGCYTFRPENRFLPKDLRNGPENARNDAGCLALIDRVIAAGIDGFFTDDPALGRQAVLRRKGMHARG
ncbi:glycerophosphodiester phosphodiesterase [Novosphingobium olei]|uniref:glycerophosphodiester phosphodiesterase n=1 Tax=Novosphingobium olei TaxID=2728851 RepID=UPI00308FAACC|nr:glycerophosphodiester phosphodiesterase [Novosphingobium olei]